MIKRYLTRGSLYVTGKDPYVEYIPPFCRVVKYDDHLAEMKAYKESIKDSLIEWHDLRENPDDLPPSEKRYDITPIIVKWKEEHVRIMDKRYTVLCAFELFTKTEYISNWAYIKPPLTHKGESCHK